MNAYTGYAIVNCSAFISFTCCCLYFYIYHTKPEIRKVYGAKYTYILLYFEISMFLATLIPTPFYTSELLCTIQGTFLEFLPIGKSLWTAFISAELYFGFKIQGIYFSMYKSLAFVILLALILGLLPLAFGGYNYSAFCVVTNILLVLCTFYAVLWIVQIWNAILLRMFLQDYERINPGGIGASNMRIRFKIYPVLIIVCYLPITLLKLSFYFGKDPAWGLYIGIFTYRLSGLINLIMYGYNHEFKKALFSKTYRVVDENLITLGRE